MRRPKGNPHYFLAQFLPLAAMVLAAATFYYFNSIDAELNRLQLEQRERVSLGAATLSNDMEAPLRHLNILQTEAAVVRALNTPSLRNMVVMAEDFATLMLRNPYYDQVRWIDQTGMERVRVNMGPNGPEQVPADALQSRKERRYFTDTMALPLGDMLIAPMDLNVENGRIEMPPKPTLRLAVPVADQRGNARGILVINLLMGPLLDRFADRVERGGYRAMLLNSDGYWLYSTNTDDEWAFMYKRELTMNTQYPQVWKAMASQPAGYLRDGGIWSWQQVRFDGDVTRYRAHHQAPWTVALYLPRQRVLVSSHDTLMQVTLYVAVIWLALAALSWQLAVNRSKREAAVHDRLRTESQLAATEERVAELERHQETRLMLASIVASSEDAIIGTSLDDLINSWNPGAEKLFGYLSWEVLNQSAYVLVPPDRTDEARGITAQIIQGQTVVNLETVRWHKDGRLLDISVTVSPIRDGQKKIIGISYIARDITGRKRLEKELNQHRLHLEALVEQQTANLRDVNRNLELALSKSESATRAKSSFLSNMSHEIRTPMNAVLGLTYLMEKTSLSPDQRDLVRKIVAAGQSLLGIINDILDVSKIEAGRLELEEQPFRLSTVLENVVNVNVPNLGSKDVELLVGFHDVNVEHLHGDALRLQQILTNLISNAIKFTARGEISVHVAVVSEAGDQVTLRFAVTDSGIGIPLARQQDIFQAFTQEDVSTTRRYGGTGLGLTICRHLVQLMNGQIGVTSEPGKGSQFWFTLPFRVLPQALEELPADTRLSLLVADDSEAARTILADTVKAMGWQVETVDSGEAAVALANAHLHQQTFYDILLLDWRMPGMDGMEAARVIRLEAARHGQHPIVIMVTAHARDDVLNTPEAALIDAVIAKPVTPSTLYNTIVHALQRRNNGAAHPLAAAPAARQHLSGTGSQGGQDERNERGDIGGVRVLVVDDSEINREVARRILEAEGVEVFCVADGSEAVGWLCGSPQGVDLVLMDVQMPVMDGYSATREIRNTLEMRELPVIALTAGAFTLQQEAALEAGMNGFLSKPYNVEQIVNVVREYSAHLPAVELARRRGDMAATAAVAQEPAVEPLAQVQAQVQEPAAPATYAALDISVGLEAWGSEDLYRKFLGKFADQYVHSGRDILARIAAGDYVQAKTLAHKLRGSAGTLALKQVQRLAGELEALLVAQADDCKDKAGELEAALQHACADIAAYVAEVGEVARNRVGST